MAQPALIYAFDNLGPNKFAELCSLLLGARYRGFLASGPGPDGGADGAITPEFGLWHVEAPDAIGETIYRPNSRVLFQFKHVVTARAGQVSARQRLRSYTRCSSKRKCELHKGLLAKKPVPDAYVMLTNVEVTQAFREEFVAACRQENPRIGAYQLIGLDDLEGWIASSPELRSSWFPTIYGPPRFNLRVRAMQGEMIMAGGGMEPIRVPMFQVAVSNVGMVTSYVSSVVVHNTVGGRARWSHLLEFGSSVRAIRNPSFGDPLEPGRCHTWHHPLEDTRRGLALGEDGLAIEVIVRDEIDNTYRAPIPDDVRAALAGT